MSLPRTAEAYRERYGLLDDQASSDYATLAYNLTGCAEPWTHLIQLQHPLLQLVIECFDAILHILIGTTIVSTCTEIWHSDVWRGLLWYSICTNVNFGTSESCSIAAAGATYLVVERILAVLV